MNEGHTVKFKRVTQIQTFAGNEQGSHSLLPQGQAEGQAQGNWLYLNPKAIVGLHLWETDSTELGTTEATMERELVGAGAGPTGRGSDWPTTTPKRPNTS